MTRRCTCSSTHRRRRRPPAGSPSILRTGLDGLSAAEVLATPAEFTTSLGLADLVSPLRLRGMSAMLSRIKRQVTAKAGTAQAEGAPAGAPQAGPGTGAAR